MKLFSDVTVPDSWVYLGLLLMRTDGSFLVNSFSRSFAEARMVRKTFNLGPHLTTGDHLNPPNTHPELHFMHLHIDRYPLLIPHCEHLSLPWQGPSSKLRTKLLCVTLHLPRGVMTCWTAALQLLTASGDNCWIAINTILRAWTFWGAEVQHFDDQALVLKILWADFWVSSEFPSSTTWQTPRTQNRFDAFWPQQDFQLLENATQNFTRQRFEQWSCIRGFWQKTALGQRMERPIWHRLCGEPKFLDSAPDFCGCLCRDLFQKSCAF